MLRKYATQWSFDTQTDDKLVHPMNTEEPVSFTQLGIEMEESPVHPENACSPTKETESGISTSFRTEHPVNA